MSPVDQALQTLLGWFRAVFQAFLAIFGLIEGYLREVLVQIGVPARLHGAIILLAALAFIVATVRLFGGRVPGFPGRVPHPAHPARVWRRCSVSEPTRSVRHHNELGTPRSVTVGVRRGGFQLRLVIPAWDDLSQG